MMSDDASYCHFVCCLSKCLKFSRSKISGDFKGNGYTVRGGNCLTCFCPLLKRGLL